MIGLSKNPDCLTYCITKLHIVTYALYCPNALFLNLLLYSNFCAKMYDYSLVEFSVYPWNRSMKLFEKKKKKL